MSEEQFDYSKIDPKKVEAGKKLAISCINPEYLAQKRKNKLPPVDPKCGYINDEELENDIVLDNGTPISDIKKRNVLLRIKDKVLGKPKSCHSKLYKSNNIKKG